MKVPFAQFVKNKLGSKTLLITCGLPATWKTETSAEVSKIKGYLILRSDLLRLEVLNGEDVFDAKYYQAANQSNPRTHITGLDYVDAAMLWALIPQQVHNLQNELLHQYLL